MLLHISVSTWTKITTLSLLVSERLCFQTIVLTPLIVFPINPPANPQSEGQGFHLQHLSEMSSFIKAAMIFSFYCHYIGSEQTLTS